MKKSISIVPCLIGIIFIIIPVSAQQPTWQEGFETYTSGSFPSSWVPDGNASNINTNYVTTSAYLNGEKSLQLFGVLGGCWAAITYHELAISPPFEIEVAVRNGNESLTGCNPDRVSIHLRQGTLWQNPARVLINFKGDGTITSASGNVLQTYETLAWYTIKIRYERPTPAQVEISYWINGNYKSKETLELVNSEDLMTNLELSVLEGTAWFDDIRVIPLQAIQNISLSEHGAIANAISQGTYMGNTQYASYAIDGDQSSSWSSQGDMPAWLKVKFDKVYEIEQVGVWWASHKHTFSIELSLDGNNWTEVVSSRSSNNSEGSAPVHELFPIDLTKAQYIKLKISSTSAPSSHIFQASVGEIEAFTDILADTVNLKFSIAVHQNPAATKYANIVVAAESPLQEAPFVSVKSAVDSVAVPMVLLQNSNTVYSGSYVFKSSSSHAIYSHVTTETGASKDSVRTVNVVLAKPAALTTVSSLDKKASLVITPKTIDKETYFISEVTTENGTEVYSFSPGISFNDKIQLEIKYDAISYTDVSKLFIYEMTEEGWMPVRSQVYQSENKLKAYVGTLGKYKISSNPSFEGYNRIPETFALKQNYPNPFNPTTTLQYDLPETDHVSLFIYNILGKQVATLVNGFQLAGKYSLTWDAKSDLGDRLASGIYFYQIRTSSISQVKKMILMK